MEFDLDADQVELQQTVAGSSRTGSRSTCGPTGRGRRSTEGAGRAQRRWVCSGPPAEERAGAPPVCDRGRALVFEQLAPTSSPARSSGPSGGAARRRHGRRGPVRRQGSSPRRSTTGPPPSSTPTTCDVLLVVETTGSSPCPADLAAGRAPSPLDPFTPVGPLPPRLPRCVVVGDPTGRRRRRLGTVLTRRRAGRRRRRGPGDRPWLRAGAGTSSTSPIGSFQAIKHLLADRYVRHELARADLRRRRRLDDPAATTPTGRRGRRSCSPARPASTTPAPPSRSSAGWGSPGTCCRTTC